MSSPLQQDNVPKARSEADRQNHYILHDLVVRRVSGGKLIYPPDVELRPGDRVLDSGTGTGIFLRELADRVPSGVHLIGTDPFDDLFPSPETLPANLSFHCVSSTALPEKWTSSFAFAHQRLLILNITKDQWSSILQQLHRVLKPGGSIQLLEIDVELPDAPVSNAISPIWEALYERNERNFRAAKDLPAMLTEAGFVDVHHVRKQMVLGASGGDDGVALAKNVLGVMRSRTDDVVKLGMIAEDEYLTILEALRREWDEQAGLSMWFTIAWART